MASTFPVVAQRQFPIVLRTIEIPQFHFDKVIDVPVVQVERAPSAVVESRGVLSASCGMKLAHRCW